jgi:5-(aminomethyl)-3-furanmethanol phosphate kinase
MARPSADEIVRPSTVVKVGGSLFDLSDLGPRLQNWLDELLSDDFLLVPGGGPTAEVIRDLDRRHGLGEEKAHWLALRALSLNAQFLTDLLPFTFVMEYPEEWAAGRCSGCVGILDPFPFCRRDDRERSKEALPHSWEVTSDAVAARVAVAAGARRLILLKSVTIPEGINWEEAGHRGFVDQAFAAVVHSAPTPLEVRAVNLREWR